MDQEALFFLRLACGGLVGGGVYGFTMQGVSCAEVFGALQLG